MQDALLVLAIVAALATTHINLHSFLYHKPQLSSTAPPPSHRTVFLIAHAIHGTANFHLLHLHPPTAIHDPVLGYSPTCHTISLSIAAFYICGTALLLPFLPRTASSSARPPVRANTLWTFHYVAIVAALAYVMRAGRFAFTAAAFCFTAACHVPHDARALLRRHFCVRRERGAVKDAVNDVVVAMVGWCGMGVPLWMLWKMGGWMGGGGGGVRGAVAVAVQEMRWGCWAGWLTIFVPHVGVVWVQAKRAVRERSCWLRRGVQGHK